jgi:hypothetical protein
MPWTAEQIAAMDPDYETAEDGVLLPSLKHACSELELEEGEYAAMRMQLHHAQQQQLAAPVFECTKVRDMRRLLRCPVCHTTPAAAEMVSICAQHHHLCFRCLLGVLSSANPVCPMRCGPLAPGPLPSPLLRALLEHLDAKELPSEEWHLYHQLVHCGYYAKPWCLAQLHQFSAMMRDDATLQRLRGCIDAYRNYRAYLNALPPSTAAPTI